MYHLLFRDQLKGFVGSSGENLTSNCSASFFSSNSICETETTVLLSLLDVVSSYQLPHEHRNTHWDMVFETETSEAIM